MNLFYASSEMQIKRNIFVSVIKVSFTQRWHNGVGIIVYSK